jgi:hypothetical protein
LNLSLSVCFQHKLELSDRQGHQGAQKFTELWTRK